LATSALQAIWPGRVGVSQACRTLAPACTSRGAAANRAEDDTPAAGTVPGLSAAATAAAGAAG
jgi:hypothetical protein